MLIHQNVYHSGLALAVFNQQATYRSLRNREIEIFVYRSAIVVVEKIKEFFLYMPDYFAGN